MRRSYKAPKIHEDALQIIKDVAGTQLDAELVKYFLIIPKERLFGSVQSFCTATETLRTAERSFQRKNIGHAAEKQFWKGLRDAAIFECRKGTGRIRPLDAFRNGVYQVLDFLGNFNF